MEQEREGSRRDGAPRKHFGQRKQTHDERLHQILGAATELIGQYGFYGTSLHQIADAVGMTNAGVLHYVRNKNELMTMVLESSYDEGNPVWMFLRDRLAAQTAASISSTHIPVLYRRTVEVNETRPDMVRLFSVLGAEALQPDHPAHDYFQRREKAFWERFRNIAWKVPPGTDLEGPSRHGYAQCIHHGQQRHGRHPAALAARRLGVAEPALVALRGRHLPQPPMGRLQIDTAASAAPWPQPQYSWPQPCPGNGDGDGMGASPHRRRPWRLSLGDPIRLRRPIRQSHPIRLRHPGCHGSGDTPRWQWSTPSPRRGRRRPRAW